MNVEEGAGAVKKRVRRKNRCLQRKTDSEHYRYDVKYGENYKKSTKIFMFHIMFFKRIIRGSTFKIKGIYAIMTPV